MRLGIPGGLLFYTYEPFIRSFFQCLSVDVSYSTDSSKEIFKLGNKNCVDEACLPIKIFHGHVMKLQESCDFIVIPRIVNCDHNQSICPKFDGLPELVRCGTRKNNYVLTMPLYIYNHQKLYENFRREFTLLGIPQRSVKRAFDVAIENQRNTSRGINETEYKYKIFLSGHPYHIYDSFVNMNIIEKLHALDIGIITEEWISRSEKQKQYSELIKSPYWLFFMNQYGAANALNHNREIDGIISLSSFCCGTDSFTIEMIRNRVGKDLPYLVLKLDEHSGEAGYDTRLEAFEEVIKCRKNKGIIKGGMKRENYLSAPGGCTSSGSTFF